MQLTTIIPVMLIIPRKSYIILDYVLYLGLSTMGLVYKTRIGKKNTLYIPKGIAEAVGIKEGTSIRLMVKNNKIIIEPLPNPFDLALNYPKFAKTSFKEFEKESEELQDELFRGKD